MVDASHGRGVQAGDHNRQTNVFLQHQPPDLGALSPHRAAAKLGELSRDDAVVVLARMPVEDAAAILEVVVADDEDLAVSLLAHMNHKRAKEMVAVLSAAAAWLADLPVAVVAIAGCERRWRERLGERAAHVEHAGASPHGTHGFRQRHRDGTIHWSAGSGARVTLHGFDQFHLNRGGAYGPLGFPTTDEMRIDATPERPSHGWCQRFEGGTVYHPEQNGYISLNREISDYQDRTSPVDHWFGFTAGQEAEAVSPYGTEGRYQRSEGLGGGTIHTAPALGTFLTWFTDPLHQEQGGAAGWLGFPTSEEIKINSSLGYAYRQAFEGGAIYGKDPHGAIAVTRAVADLLATDQRLARRIGFPVAAAQALATGDGDRLQLFENGVVTVRDGVVRAWVEATVATPERIPLTDDAGHGWAFSADRKLAAVSSGVAVRLFRASDGEHVRDLPGRRAYLGPLAFAADGTMLAAGGRDKVWLWNPATGEELGNLVTGDEGEVRALAFSGEGHLAVASIVRPHPGAAEQNSIIRIYDPETGRQLREPHLRRNAVVTTLGFAPGDDALTFGTSNGVLWLIGRGGQTISGASRIMALAFSLDGHRLASAHQDGSVRLRDPNGGEPSSIDGGPIRALTFEPDGSLLTLVAGESGTEIRRLRLSGS